MSAPPQPDWQARRREQTRYDHAAQLWKIASDEAHQIAGRMHYAARAVAVERFSEIWPKAETESKTRDAFQDWYLYVFDQQLAEPITGRVDLSIPGTEAGNVLATVQGRTHASNETVIATIAALARDSEALAHRTAIGRAELVEAGLHGRLSTLFPRRASDVGVRQAVAEQWYARCFRAVINPRLFGIATAPVTPAEVHVVGVSLAAGQARILHRGDQPFSADGQQEWRQRTAWAWVNQTPKERETWLRRHGDTREELAMSSFGQLPAYLRALLMEERPPTELLSSLPIAAGTPVQQAAKMFATTPIEPATTSELNSQRLIFNRGGVTIPAEMITQRPELTPVTEALNRLRSENQRRKETVGLNSRLDPRSWWRDETRLDQAVRMRIQENASVKEIADTLGISETSLRYGLTHSENVDRDALKLNRTATNWTQEQLVLAAALRHHGLSYETIGANFDVSGGSIRQALLSHADELGLDGTTGKPLKDRHAPPDQDQRQVEAAAQQEADQAQGSSAER